MSHPISRRDLLRYTGYAGTAAAISATLAACGGPASTNKSGGVLSDENGMATVGRLPAVVAWLGRGKPVTDQFFRVPAHGRKSAQVDHCAVAASQLELRSEGVLPNPVQPGVQLVVQRNPSMVDQCCLAVMLNIQLIPPTVYRV